MNIGARGMKFHRYIYYEKYVYVPTRRNTRPSNPENSRVLRIIGPLGSAVVNGAIRKFDLYNAAIRNVKFNLLFVCHIPS